MAWRCRVQQFHRGASEGVGQLAEYTQLGFDAAVFDLGEVGGRASDALAEDGQCEAGLPTEVAESVTEHHRIKGLCSHD